MSNNSEEFSTQQENLKSLVTDLEGEVESFKKKVEEANDLDDLSQLKYQDILDKASEIELAVDNMPAEDEDEDEEL